MHFCYYCLRLIPDGEEVRISVGEDKRFGHTDCMDKMFGKHSVEQEVPAVAERYDEFAEMCKELDIDNKLEA